MTVDALAVHLQEMMDHISPDALEEAAVAVLSNTLESPILTFEGPDSEHEAWMKEKGMTSQGLAGLQPPTEIAAAMGSHLGGGHNLAAPSFNTPIMSSFHSRNPRPQEEMNQLQADRILQRRQCRVKLQAERAMRGYFGGQVQRTFADCIRCVQLMAPRTIPHVSSTAA